MKKFLVFLATFALVAAHSETSSTADATELHEDTDVSRERIELPYHSSIFIKKRLTHGHTYSTDMSNPNLIFLSDTVVENFQFFEIACNVCEPDHELALVLREIVPQLGFGGTEPEIRAYNVYVVY